MAGPESPTDLVSTLAATLAEARGLLEGFSSEHDVALPRQQDFGSLVEQCVALCGEGQALEREPVRLLHHFACTGGTLLSKCVAAMPNVQLLSEVNPLSTLNDLPGKPGFAPTDMIRQMRQSTRGVDRDLIIGMFQDNLELIHDASVKQGYRLVLRDHAHSHYCNGADVARGPRLAEIVAQRHEVLSAVTVRHPVESFLSLKSQGWNSHFQPGTFDEYCRRYVRFLRDHSGVPVIRYEDFLASPPSVMETLCDCLALPFSDQFEVLFGVFALTGDSGRARDRLEPRDRRDVDHATAAEIAASTHYPTLKSLLGYE